MNNYLQKKAENWVSYFVLIGCVLITALLFFLAYRADALGGKLGEPKYTTSDSIAI